MDNISLGQIILSSILAISVIGAILVVVSENRNPIRTQAWVILLVTLPVVGIILYYFFGQNTRKVKRMSVKYYKRVKELTQESLLPTDNVQCLERVSGLVSMLQQINGAYLLQGSEVEVITSGPRKFEALLNDIRNARHHIHFEYFIFSNDATGKQIKEILIEKAKEGVEVRFLYDHLASWFVPPSFFNEMRKEGVLVSPFFKRFYPVFRSRANYRNHRKIVVIDGNIGYIGGMNVGDNYSARGSNWRDTHLRIQGRGVHGLQATFLIDWQAVGGGWVEYKNYFPDCEIKTDNLMQIVSGAPVYPHHNLLKATVYIIMNARKYVYIQTPYFLPPESLFDALETAALAGIDVRLMVSKKSDSSYVDPAAHSYYEKLLKAGLRIYEMKGAFCHAKTMVCDDFISVIGSANMDFRSFETNFEVNAYLYDERLAVKNREIFFQDMLQCDEVDVQEWEKRPWLRKMFESIMRLFAPLM